MCFALVSKLASLILIGIYRPTSMGRDFSVADAHFFVVSNWASWVNFDLSPYRAVIACRERVGTRPAVLAALKTEGLVPWPATQPH
jgi:glutathione S-transferase